MLNAAELLKMKLLRLSSQAAAATFLTRLLANVEDKGSDKSPKKRWSLAAHNGKSTPAVKAYNPDALFQRLSNNPEEDEGACATQRLIGGYGIVLDHHSSQDGNRQLVDAAVTDRERKLVQVSREVESSLLSTIERSIHRASDAQHLLVDELLFDTKFNAVELSDGDIAARVKTLQGHLERIGSSVTYIDMEKLNGINKDQKDFVNKWSVT